MHSIKQLILIDQISKLIACTLIPKNLNLIEQFLALSLEKNDGVSFGFLSNLPTQQVMALKACIAVFLCLFTIYYLKNKASFSYIKHTGFELIIAGGLSNLLDRLLYGAVIDFISISFFGQHLFVCNFGDIFITIGAICVLIGGDKKTPKANEVNFKDILRKEDSL